MINYASDFMSGVGEDVKELGCHVLCSLAELDLHPEGYMEATSLVEFREAIVYAFFLNLPMSDQALKTFTLCLRITSLDSLVRLMDNSMEDPLVATGLVRTLTMLVGLRKVVVEINGTLGNPNDKCPDALSTSKLFQRLSIRLGPCKEEKSIHSTKKGQTFFRRLAYFPAAHWRSEISGI